MRLQRDPLFRYTAEERKEWMAKGQEMENEGSRKKEDGTPKAEWGVDGAEMASIYARGTSRLKGTHGLVWGAENRRRAYP